MVQLAYILVVFHRRLTRRWSRDFSRVPAPVAPVARQSVTAGTERDQRPAGG